MRVQEVILEEGKRYILVDREGIPVIPVMKYLKFLDVTGKSSNTQKTYCYALKQYFLYLQETGKDYKQIRLEDLVEFVGWLRNPYGSTNVTSLQPVQAKKTERTVNLTVTTVTNFYDYLYSNEELPHDSKHRHRLQNTERNRYFKTGTFATIKKIGIPSR